MQARRNHMFPQRSDGRCCRNGGRPAHMFPRTQRRRVTRYRAVSQPARTPWRVGAGGQEHAAEQGGGGCTGPLPGTQRVRITCSRDAARASRTCSRSTAAALRSRPPSSPVTRSRHAAVAADMLPRGQHRIGCRHAAARAVGASRPVGIRADGDSRSAATGGGAAGRAHDGRFCGKRRAGVSVVAPM